MGRVILFEVKINQKVIKLYLLIIIHILLMLNINGQSAVLDKEFGKDGIVVLEKSSL